MSDETPPPSLRLRPRVRTEDAASNAAAASGNSAQIPAPPSPSKPFNPTQPATFPPSALIGEIPAPRPAAPTIPPTGPSAALPSAASPTPAPAPGSDAAPRFRLKPKISLDPDATGTGKTMMAAIAETVPPPEPIKSLTATEIPVEPEVPRLKLKSLVVDAAAPGSATPPLSPSALIGGLPPVITPSTLIGGGAFPPPPAVGNNPPLPPGAMLPLPPEILPSTLIGALPPVVVARSSEATSIPSHSPLPLPGVVLPRPSVPPPPIVPPVPNKAKLKVAPVPWYKTIPLLVSIVVLLVGAGGWTAYFLLSESPPPAIDPSHGGKPADPNSLGKVTPPPIDPLAAQDSGTRIAPLPPQPDQPKGIPPAPKNTGSVVNNSAAALALRSWTENARITGVLSGDSPRAIINGRLVRPGEMIDAAEGVSLDGIDTEKKVLIFRNRTGLFSTKPF